MQDTYCEVTDCRNGWSKWAVMTFRNRATGRVVGSFSLPSREEVYIGDGHKPLSGQFVMLEATLTAKP